MHGRTLILLFTCLVYGLLSPWSSASAQSDPPDQVGDAKPDPSAAKSSDVMYEKGPDGKWRAVPVEQGRLPSITDLLPPTVEHDPLVPDYFLSKLNVDGEVAGDWAKLTVHIEARVVTDSEWLTVPLRLDQSLLLNYTHEGAGEAVPSTISEQSGGHTWLLRGKGVHQLTLSLRAPIRRTTGVSHLQLFTPDLSDFWAGDLSLRLPDNSSVETGDNLQLLVPPTVVDQRTEIRASFTGNRIDVRWRPIVRETTSISRTLTHVSVRLRGDRMQLSARQEVRLRSAGLADVEVRLPSAPFALSAPVRISEASGAERQVEPLPADREGWVRVPLEGLIGAIVRFDWSFEAPFDESMGQLVLDGLEVAGADDQSGTISIEGFDRHLLTRRPDFDEGVTRIGVDELPAAGAFANLAYRFQTGRYRLVLDVNPIQSTFRVTPVHVLDLTSSKAELTTRLTIGVDEGQVDALSINWPRFAEQGWTVDPVAIGGGEMRRDEVSGDGTATELNGAAVRWLLKPSSPLVDGAQPGFTAGRQVVPVGKETTLALSLPQATGARRLPGVLVVATADNIEGSVKPRPGTTLLPLRSLPADQAWLLDTLADRSRSIFQIVPDDENVEPEVVVTLSLRDRRVRANSTVTIEDIESSPQVTQTFDYSVEFGRLSSVRLHVPDLLLKEISEEFPSEALGFHLDGQRIEATWRGGDVELHFPEPRRGSFQISVGPYAVSTLRSGKVSIQVPILTSVDWPPDSVRVKTLDATTVAVTLDDDAWTQLTTVPGGREWITSDESSGVTLRLDHALERISQRLAIATAYIESRIDESGTVLTTANYKVDADRQRLVIRLPAGAEAARFRWNGNELSADKVREVPEIAGQYRIERPPEDDGSAAWMAVSYRTRNRPLNWQASTPVQLPSFGGGATIERTFWNVSLPKTQHLLSHPADLSPQYGWVRDGLVWRRTTVAAFQDTWQELAVSGVVTASSPPGNSYAFETLSSVSEVRINTINSSLLVFLGAGTTLVASFLVLKVPSVRSLWLWLLIGTVLAVLSLWHLEAVILLLQPAAYGLILPAGAAVFERLTDRRAVISETLSTRASFELNVAAADSSMSGFNSDDRSGVPSTSVRKQALSDSGVR